MIRSYRHFVVVVVVETDCNVFLTHLHLRILHISTNLLSSDHDAFAQHQVSLNLNACAQSDQGIACGARSLLSENSRALGRDRLRSAVCKKMSLIMRPLSTLRLGKFKTVFPL